MDNVIIYDKLEELNEGIESNGEGINDLKQDAAALLAKGVVKSVQRGYERFKQNYDTAKTINISEVNANKSIVILNIRCDSTTPNVLGIALVNLTNNSFQVKCCDGSNAVDVYFSWQVIEFY